MDGNWGSTAGVYGSLFSYNSDGPPKSTLGLAVDGANPALHLTGSVNPAMMNGGYAGAGLSFKVCATAAAYKGIQFAMAGSTGGCALELQLQTYGTKQGNGGGCSPECAFSSKTNLSPVEGQVLVAFSDLSKGKASGAAVDFNPAELVGIQFQLTIPPGAAGGPQTACAVDLTIDDITLTK
jgi:hypothetical protein